MALTDGFADQTGQPDDENELRRLGLILGSRLKPRSASSQPAGEGGSRGSVLGNRGSYQPPTSEAAPGSRDYDLRVNATNQPRIPASRTIPEEAPTFLGPSSAGSVLGAQPQPVRPNVRPTREDFPAKPELGGWKKYLGLGLATLAGPQAAGPLAEKILHGQRDKAERQYQGAEQEWERGQVDEERAARIANLRSEARARDAKPAPETKPEIEVFNDLLKQGKTPQQAYEIIKQSGQKPPTPTFEEQTYQEWVKTHPGGTRLQFEKERSAVTQKPERPEKPQRMMGVTPDGKVMEITPGMTLPPGTKSLGGELTLTAKTEQGEEAGKSAVAYANDYISAGAFSGPGDEALMEKFFEMAKPSSGFRMTEAQMRMLRNAQGWMNGLEAKAHHAIYGTWFSDQLRKDIVKTMNDLGKSRQEIKPSSGGATGGAVRFSDGGRNFAIPADQVNEFLKDHPNAQRR